jgi:hypothetical protein
MASFWGDRAGSEIRAFLRDELALSPTMIEFVLGQCRVGPQALPTILWRYGLLTIDQFAALFAWLNNRAAIAPEPQKPSPAARQGWDYSPLR